MNAIEIKNVTKRFKEKIALDNISFQVKEGEIYGIIGPNGAGKSTLLNIITGIIDGKVDSVKICGHDIYKEEIKAKEAIGYVMQELALLENLNPVDNLEYFGALYGLRGRLLKERIEEVLKITGLEEAKKKKVSKFSGGMKRRLHIGIALMHHPRVLILDEPTVGVDTQSRNHIFQFIKNIVKERGTTILYTSHYMEEVEMLCDRIFIMDEGKEIAEGTKEHIKKAFSKNKKINIEVENIEGSDIVALKEVNGIINIKEEKEKSIITLEINNDFKISSVVLILEGREKSIKNIEYIEDKLEDIFLNLTGKALRD